MFLACPEYQKSESNSYKNNDKTKVESIAEEDADLAFKQFCKSKRELWKLVPWESRVGFEVRNVLRFELGLEWQGRMKVMEKSVDYLVKKHKLLRREEVPAMWRGIKIADRALENQIPLPPPMLGENVGQISDAAKEVLKLPSLPRSG